MDFSGINYLAVGAAVIASMMIGAFWYGTFAKQWMKAAEVSHDDVKQEPKLYIIAVIFQIIMAWMLAGVIGHLGVHTLTGGLTVAAFCWFGFVMPPMAVNHRFQGNGWDLTLIDGGQWLAVLLAQGAIIGYFGT